MAYIVMFSVVDEKGKSSITEAKVPASTTWADVVLFAQAMATLINALIVGAITRIGISAEVALPGGLRASPSANSDVEEGARFQFRTENGFFSGMRLPTFSEAKIVAGTRGVNLTDPDVAAFVTAMEEGIEVNEETVEPCDVRGEDLTALEFAREQFLSSRG